jgi:hypothetical protein
MIDAFNKGDNFDLKNQNFNFDSGKNAVASNDLNKLIM